MSWPNTIRLDACASILLGAQLMAQPRSATGARPWTIGVAAQTDDESSRGESLSFGIGLAEKTWLSLFAASTSSPVERADVSADTFVVALDRRFEAVGFTLEAEQWGDSGAVESIDLSGSAYWQNDRLRLEIGIEQRDIDITLTPALLNDRFRSRKVPLSADGRWFALRASVTDRVDLLYEYQTNDYSRNLAVVPRVDALNLLSTSTLTLANSFVSEIQSVGIEISIGEKLLSLSADKDRSAVDRTSLTSIGAAIILPVANRVDLEFSLGRSDSDLFNAGSYAGIAFMFYGGA